MHRRSACGNPLYFPWDVGKQACSSLYLPNYHTESIYYSTISRIPPLFSRWANGPWSRTVWTLSLAQWRKYMQHPLLVFVFLCCRDQQRFSFRYILLRMPYFLIAYWFELHVTGHSPYWSALDFWIEKSGWTNLIICLFWTWFLLPV